MEEVHTQYLHIGAPKMIALLQPTYWWPMLDKDCATYMSHCLACQLKCRVKGPGWSGLMIEPPAGPRIEWALDLMTDLPYSLQGDVAGTSKVHIIVAIDVYSKFALIGTLPRKSAQHVTTFIRAHLISVFGPPQRFCTDNGGEFAGILSQVCDALDIQFTRTSYFHS